MVKLPTSIEEDLRKHSWIGLAIGVVITRLILPAETPPTLLKSIEITLYGMLSMLFSLLVLYLLYIFLLRRLYFSALLFWNAEKIYKSKLEVTKSEEGTPEWIVNTKKAIENYHSASGAKETGEATLKAYSAILVQIEEMNVKLSKNIEETVTKLVTKMGILTDLERGVKLSRDGRNIQAGEMESEILVISAILVGRIQEFIQQTEQKQVKKE